MPKKTEIDTSLTKIDLDKIAEIFDKNKIKDLPTLELIERAKNMQSVLLRLEKQAAEEELVTDMCQGKYSIKRRNPTLQAYREMSGEYLKYISDIRKAIPEEEKKEKKDSFESFD